MKVWDGPVRLFHWSLVVGVSLAGITGFFLGGRAIDIHIWAGTAAALLVGLRVVWGFLGPGFARFSDFVKGPGAARIHLAGGHRSLGHNPLGGWMVVAMILVVLALALTGALVLGGTFHAGPARALETVAGGFAWRGPHNLLALLLVAMIAAHLAGVVVESRRGSENLVRAMITGLKPARPGDPALPNAKPRPRLAALIAAGLVLIVGGGATVLSGAPVPRAPVAIAGTDYQTQCSDCHIAYHPSLLPAASWHKLMAGLDDHFGEDATLSPAETASVTAFLTAHAAGVTDTRAAVMLRSAAGLSITDSRAWRRLHHELPDAVFRMPEVGAKGNCAACHADAASGWFYPGKIDVPEPGD